MSTVPQITPNELKERIAGLERRLETLEKREGGLAEREVDADRLRGELQNLLLRQRAAS